MCPLVNDEEAAVIALSGQQNNKKVVLFNGLPVDVSDASEEAFALNTLAVSLYNTPRWNGHIRLPEHFAHNGRTLDDGTGRRYAFYSVMSHSVLVALCAIKLAETHSGETDIHRIIRLSLIHEAPEEIIGDLPGPFKRLVKEHVKRFEDKIQTVAFKSAEAQLRAAFNDSEISFPEASQAERALIKSADIMAQDIEAHFGMQRHILGVNISKTFFYAPWMKEALRKAINLSVQDFVSAFLLPERLLEKAGFEREVTHTPEPCGVSYSGSFSKRAEEARALGGNTLDNHAAYLLWGTSLRTNPTLPKPPKVLLAKLSKLRANELSFLNVQSLMAEYNQPSSRFHVFETIRHLAGHGVISALYTYRASPDDVGEALTPENMDIPANNTVLDTVAHILKDDTQFVDPVSGEDIPLEVFVSSTSLSFLVL